MENVDYTSVFAFVCFAVIIARWIDTFFIFCFTKIFRTLQRIDTIATKLESQSTFGLGFYGFLSIIAASLFSSNYRPVSKPSVQLDTIIDLALPYIDQAKQYLQKPATKKKSQKPAAKPNPEPVDPQLLRIIMQMMEEDDKKMANNTTPQEDKKTSTSTPPKPLSSKFVSVDTQCEPNLKAQSSSQSQIVQ
jgi:hypothetical protein